VCVRGGIFGPTQPDAGEQRPRIEADRGQRAQEELVVLEAIAAPPLVDELVEDMIGIEADAASQPHIEILERNGEPMRALHHRQPVDIGRRRQSEPKTREIGVEVERCAYLHAPMRWPVPVVTIFTGWPSLLPVDTVEIE